MGDRFIGFIGFVEFVERLKQLAMGIRFPCARSSLGRLELVDDPNVDFK